MFIGLLIGKMTFYFYLKFMDNEKKKKKENPKWCESFILKGLKDFSHVPYVLLVRETLTLSSWFHS